MEVSMWGYKNMYPTGQGTYTWPNGKKYVGQWKDAERNGQGTQTLLDGDKYVGEYKNGVRWNRKYYFRVGQTKQYVNGKPDKL